MSFLNYAMLLGLAAVSIPIIIHLLNRRRYDVVDWGAMQFLQISEVTRRRLLIEEILLMLLRMGLIAVLVMALASPVLTSKVFRGMGARAPRDVVLILDGSASMGYTGTSDGVSPHERAQLWAESFLGQLNAGDTVAVLQAKQQVLPIIPAASLDLRHVRDQLGSLPPPSGGSDLPGAIQEAERILAHSQRSGRDIIVLTDGQRQGWADPVSQLRWSLLATDASKDSTAELDFRPPPRVLAVNLDPEKKTTPASYALAPLRVTRPVVPVGREVTFRSDLELSGQASYSPPHRLRLEVDGKHIRDLATPEHAEIVNGKVPFSFTHRFTEPGSHLVTVQLEPDLPPGERPEGYQVLDHLPGDNRQDYALEVLTALPVLLVDGDTDPLARKRSTDYLRDALSPERDPHPAVRTRVVSVDQLTPEMLTGTDSSVPPRVVILSNVAQLDTPQREALTGFLAEGGGLLVALGDRVNAEAYNQTLYRDGQSWLPAKLLEQEGDPEKLEEAAQPVPTASTHPILDLFRKDVGVGSLGTARLPRWWKVSTGSSNAAGVTVATLRTPQTEVPFLVERYFRAGRVLLCTVPLDISWGSTLPKLPAFVPLAHEMVYYLAGARSADFNLQPGQPIQYRLADGRGLENFTLQTPGEDARPVTTETTNELARRVSLVQQPRGALLSYAGTVEPGIYRLNVPRRILVFCRPEAVEEARRAGADHAGGEDLIQKVRDESWVSFDVSLTTRDMMPALRPLAAFLEPRGLFPGDHPGTILDSSSSLPQAIERLKERTIYYVVESDPRELDLTPATEEEKARVAEVFPLSYENDVTRIVGEMATLEERPEVWWWFLLGLVALLCLEVWMTRRMALNR